MKKTALKEYKGFSLSHPELEDYCKSFKERFKLKERELVLQLCDNTVNSAAFFFGCISNKVVPLMINGNIDKDLFMQYISIYKPNYIYKNRDVRLQSDWDVVTACDEHVLLEAKEKTEHILYDQLSLLLPTSGSTGSPKLVRHSYRNIEASAVNVANAFKLCGNERTMLSLPIYFTQGLSVLCSHIHAGAMVYLTDDALTDLKFWDALQDEKITSYSGVPYSYEIMDKLRFYKMDLPSLKVINQGGGRLTDKLWDKLAYYAKETGREFIATYGATETTARMSMLPPGLAIEKRCSIGKPLGDYEIWLEDDAGSVITECGASGELVFKGESVTLGYAESLADLSKGDERYGIYKTGDIAYRDKDGFYFITGRLSRFIKVFGLRIGLDEAERLIKSRFGDGFVCTGSDEQLFVCTTDRSADRHEIRQFLKDKLKINISAFEVAFLDEIPKNQSGKTNYSELKKLL